MKFSRLALPIATGLLLLAGTLAYADTVAVREALLPGATEPVEMHLGDDGQVWVSDYDSGQVWQIDPVTKAYRRFNLPGAVDARPGPGGYAWWLGIHNHWLGRLEIATGQVTTWTMPVDYIWGLAFDDDGRVWVGGDDQNMLIRFDPVTHQQCEFHVFNNPSGYMAFYNGAIWYGEDTAGLGRLNTTTNVNTFWAFSGDNFGAWSVSPGADGVWFVDDSEALVGRLDPGQNRLITYTSSLLVSESMVLRRGSKIWFTDQGGQVVALEPAVAASTSAPLLAFSETIVPEECVDAGAGVTGTTSIATGTLVFSSGTTAGTLENGMTHYALLAGSYPYGLAEVNGDLWFVDLERLSVVILEAYRVRLPVVVR